MDAPVVKLSAGRPLSSMCANLFYRKHGALLLAQPLFLSIDFQSKFLDKPVIQKHFLLHFLSVVIGHKWRFLHVVSEYAQLLSALCKDEKLSASVLN